MAKHTTEETTESAESFPARLREALDSALWTLTAVFVVCASYVIVVCFLCWQRLKPWMPPVVPDENEDFPDWSWITASIDALGDKLDIAAMFFLPDTFPIILGLSLGYTVLVIARLISRVVSARIGRIPTAHGWRSLLAMSIIGVTLTSLVAACWPVFDMLSYLQ